MQKAFNSPLVRLISISFVAFFAACFALFALNLFTPPRPLAELLPTRTATRRPPPTITPVVYPPTPEIVSRDDLRALQNFPQASGVKVGYEYTAEGYVLTPPLDPGFVRVLNRAFTTSDYRNLTLDALAAPAKNSAPVEYGVVFWHGEDEQGREHFLAFTVSTKSTFRLLAYAPVENSQDSAFKVTEIIPTTQTLALKVDGSPNHLRVDVHPRRLLAYVNDQLVLDTDDKVINDWRLSREWDGKVGIIALALDAPGAQALFTQFDIYADIKKP